MMLSMEASQ